MFYRKQIKIIEANRIICPKQKEIQPKKLNCTGSVARLNDS